MGCAEVSGLALAFVDACHVKLMAPFLVGADWPNNIEQMRSGKGM
jgi:hypothetical protein